MCTLVHWPAGHRSSSLQGFKVLVLFTEDYYHDPRRELRRIADFLDIPMLEWDDPKYAKALSSMYNTANAIGFTNRDSVRALSDCWQWSCRLG